MPPTVRAFGRDLSVRQASVWILEALQSVFALVIVCITGSAAHGFKHDLHANGYPAKLHYNIALGVITFLVFATLLTLDLVQRPFSAGNAIHPRGYHIAVNIVFLGLWIGAVASSVYTCSDLCSVGSYYTISYAGICCDCRGTARVVDCSFLNNIGYDEFFEQRTHRYEATMGIDIVVMLLFLTSILVMFWLRWKRPVYNEMGADAGRQSGGLGTGRPGSVDEDIGDR